MPIFFLTFFIFLFIIFIEIHLRLGDLKMVFFVGLLLFFQFSIDALFLFIFIYALKKVLFENKDD